MKNIKIKTERFALRPLTIDDATTRYLEWFNGSEIKSNIKYASNDLSILKLQNYILDKADSEDILMLGIFLKKDFLHIGNIKFEPVDSKRHYAVMGILIGDENWVSKGAGPEVISACLSWLYREKGIEKVALVVNDSNIRAIKAYEKIGFLVQDTSYIETPKEGNLTMVFDYEYFSKLS